MAFHSHSARLALARALLVSVGLHALILLQGGFSRLPEPAAASLMVGFRTAGGLDDPRKTAPAAASRALTTDDAAAMPLPERRGRPSQVRQATNAEPSLAAGQASFANFEPLAGLDGDALRSFRVALATELRQFRNYPAAALKQGWGGIVEVRLPIDASGMALAPQLVKSSGHEALDEQALEMVRRAAPRAALPDALRGHGFVLSLQIEFAFGAD